MPRLSSLSLSPPHPAADEHPSRVLHAVAGRGEGPCPVSRGSGERFQDFPCHTGPSSGGSGPSGPGFDSVSRIFGSPVSVVRTRCAWHWPCLASFVGPGEACPRCPRVDGARRRAFLLSGSSELHLSSETASKEGDFSPGRPGTWGNNGLVGGGVRSRCWAQPWEGPGAGPRTLGLEPCGGWLTAPPSLLASLCAWLRVARRAPGHQPHLDCG